ncbi:arf-GAP with Rho-GAP domain, ANK repeat and PH domain-containing protein 1-like isoform X2 [Mytilus californianus]|uniref:arf-GAP with Rho-GAP domain, ANK repeat and PH domain-containing protein 1-like isoform X2 n=1 Tax=Mytilus californianus TaxID=6549 RepID=UPI0022476ECB|nr:arf-GAP with Rho-GAP domain, ANK repeat and PH domain-containing protein 1-like isoform X2 [Mytilus californianus]
MASGNLNLQEWLRLLDLELYNEKFASLGLTTVEQLKEFGLDDSFLNDLGITKIGHKQRILSSMSRSTTMPLQENGSVRGQEQEDDIYENVGCPSPHVQKKEENEDIYVNCAASNSSEDNLSLKSVESADGGEVKKKPVPRPRLSKMKKEQKEKFLQQQSLDNLESIPQSPPPAASPRKCNLNIFHLSGATLDESNADDFDPFAVSRSPKESIKSTKKYSDELMNVFTSESNINSGAPERPRGFSDTFVHSNSERLSNNYDAIWASSNPTQNSSGSLMPRRASDMSPFTPPFLPVPCVKDTFDFKTDENTKNSENEPSAYEPVNVNQGKLSSAKSPKHIYVNEDSMNSESPPPPSFPPPELPPGEALPPVPPRISNSSNSSVTYSSVKKSKNVNKNVDRENDPLYSDKYLEKGYFTSTKMKTLTSTSGPDPFNGEDPFCDMKFQNECQSFNQPGADNIFDPGEPTEPAFDPFGIYEVHDQLNSGDPLERVPPAPDWHETGQPPKAAVSCNSGYSLYSLASPVQIDNSSDEQTSEGDLSDPSSPEDLIPGATGPINPSVDIVPSSPSPRKAKQKSGYLWKQGGVKANRGWRRRWVVFDGKTLRYYPNHKSQISKRIIPLACMNRVEVCVKDKNADRFKFNLINQNRTFLFAAETLNECTLWANTLMEAIINYEKPKNGEPEGGQMFDPDKMGFIKFERKGELFVAIKAGKLCYYDSHQDYKIASPINEIDMKLASVKEISRNKMQLSTHYGHFILLFTEKQDCVYWKMAMEDAIADGLGDNTVLDSVRENQSNHFCADCRAPDAHWASINIGIVLCKNCAGIHRDFDHRISRIKSLRMDTTIWTPSLIELMKAIGNENANKFWESRLQAVHGINTESSPMNRKQFIQDKYERKLWIDQHPLIGGLNEELLRVVVTEDILQTMRIVFSGADILFTDGTTGKTAFDLAKDEGQRLQTEFLYHNGGDRTSRASADIDEALALRLRAEITMEGHLLKTGPRNRNAFMDRYCVIEHGCLRYFVNEKSSTARDSIDNESMLCVQAVTNVEKSVLNLNRVRQLSVRKSIRPDSMKRYPNAFELSTRKTNNRTYLFAATTPEEKMTWMRTLTKLFCPIHFIKEIHDKEFSLAGNFYMKAGVASEWQKTWILVDRKVVRYLDDEQKLLEIDLRKVSNIQYVEHVAGQPCPYAAESGKCFTIDIPGRSLYFQADLQRDTERLYEAFGNSMKIYKLRRGGGPTIEDQQLTPENVPVIVHKCIKFIEDNGFKDEGVYRLAAQDSKIQNVLSRFLADAHSLSLRMDLHSVNEVANCLKRFFRQLKDPLFTKIAYQDWIKCAAMESVESKLSFYKFQLNQLPLVNKCTVKKLMLHLACLSTYSAENKMDIKNIALAFGSTLMKGGAEMIHQNNLPLEMRVIEDLITHHSVLFEKEKTAAQQLEEERKRILFRIKQLSFEQPVEFSQIGEMMITIYYQHRSNQSEVYSAKRGGSVGEAVEHMKRKFRLSLGQWVLYEVVYSDVLERPLHPSECLLDVVMSWSNWEEEYRKNTHLVMKSAERLLQLDEVYDPNHALFAEFKYKEKKEKFKKFSFGFNQSKLSLFKDLGYNTQPSKSWKIEDMLIYFGADPKKNAQKLSKPQNLQFAFSFFIKGERIGKGDMPLFGRTICCTTENELINWMAALLKAKHPDGFLS